MDNPFSMGGPKKSAGLDADIPPSAKVRAQAVLQGGIFHSNRHLYPARVSYSDTDAGGVMYHSAYLVAAERARSEMLYGLKCGYRRHILDAGMAFTIRRLCVDYDRPLRLGDIFLTESRILDIIGARLDLAQNIIGDARIRARIILRLACVDASGRVRRIPAAMMAALDRFGKGDPLWGKDTSNE